MGKKARSKSKASQGVDAPAGSSVALAQCLNATSQIAAECNSILRDLLRGRSPQHQDLQRLASQVLMGQTMNLQELQKKMESQQATLAELLKVLKPAGGAATAEFVPQDAYSTYPEPSISVIKGWDSLQDAAARRRRAQQQQQQHRGGRQDSSTLLLPKRERCLAVQGYWSSLDPEARRRALAVPVCKAVAAASFEGGQEAVREVRDGLKLLKRNHSQHACYWWCPCCDVRTGDPRAFMDHMATYHEEVQYACEDTPLLCTTCGQEVVGAFYHTGPAEDPTAVRCMRCSWEDNSTETATIAGGGRPSSPPGWSLFVPRGSGTILQRSWPILSSVEDSDDDDDGGGDSDSDSEDVEDDTESSDNGECASSPAEQRIRAGADGLLAAMADRVDALVRTDRAQFEMALTSVVQRAQRLMHGPPPPTEAGLDRSSEARANAASRLNDAETYPDQIQELRGSVCLLSATELQDLLAVMARRYSPNPNHHAVPRSYDVAPYNPVCVSLLMLGDSTVAPSSEEKHAGHTGSALQLLDMDDGSNGDGDDSGKAVIVGAEEFFKALPDVCDEEIVSTQGWWLHHLAEKSWGESGSNHNDGMILQWLYGNVAHAATDEFLERQRLAYGSKSPDAAVVEAYAEVAETWRHLAATMDRKRHVSTLRDAVSEDYEAVGQFDPAETAALRKQAGEFDAEVSADEMLSTAANPNANGDGELDAHWSQMALAKLQRFHQLKDEASIRYAQALIDREIAVLELAEVMDQHECDVSERELQNVEAALAAARQDLADAEAELARVQAEGPALHRRRDLLDKVNKEAEHRERVQDLQAHIASCKERIASEEAFGKGAQQRRVEAAADLGVGRVELQKHLERRQALDRACHAVLAAQERDAGQELTDAYVDARIKAVWQVVAGVADAILRLHDRYAPGSNTKESARHLRCTGLAKRLSADLDDRIRMWWDDLDKLRRRAADLACVDLGHAVEAAVLEAMRQCLESEAAAAREAATADLLRELEAEEEEAKKLAESKKAKKKGGKSGKKAKTAGAGDGGGSGRGDKEALSETPKHADSTAEHDSSGMHDGGMEAAGGPLRQEPAAEEERVSEEEEYELALERRRRELQQQELERQRQEAQLLKLAQEASLREATLVGGSKGGAVHAGRGQSSQQHVNGASSGKVAKKVVAIPVAVKSSSNKTSSGGVSIGEKSPEKSGPRVVIVQRPQTTTAPAKSTVHHSPPVVEVATSAAAATPSLPATKADISESKDKTVEMRIVTYFGDWICYCGRTNRLWDTCTCGQIPPCRDWVRGRCTYQDRCRFAHPPFELPDSLARPKSPIAKPGPDAVVYTRTARQNATTSGHTNGHGKSAALPTAVTAPPPPHVATPEAKPSAAPKSATAVRSTSATAVERPPRQTANKAATEASSASAPPPLKPAPWAGVRPGAPVPRHHHHHHQQQQLDQQQPPPPPLPQPQSSSSTPPASEPALLGSFPPQPSRDPALGSSPAVLSSGPSAATAPPPEVGSSSTGGFDLFGINHRLVPAIGRGTHGGRLSPAAGPAEAPQASLMSVAAVRATMPRDDVVSTAFSSLDLGMSPGTSGGGGGGLPSSLLSVSTGAAPSSTAQLFSQASSPGHLVDVSFLGGGAEMSGGMGFGSDGLVFGGGSGGDNASALGLGGLHQSQQQQQQQQFGGFGVQDLAVGGYQNGGGVGAEADEWADLQLQLPSDLGEMLGADSQPVATQQADVTAGEGLYGTHNAHGVWGGF